MTPKQHKRRHEELHRALDELLADYLQQHHALPSNISVMDLLQWSHEQTQNPTDVDQGG